jgi:hypothetical protein
MDGMSDSSAMAASSFNQLAAMEGWPCCCDARLAFRRREFSGLVEIWRENALPQGIPKRANITHRSLGSLLASVAIYQRIPVREGVFRYRVRMIGSVLAEMLGDMTGRFLDESVPARFLPRWQATLDACFAARSPLRFLTRSDSLNKSHVLGEYFAAPLLSENGTTDLVLAAGHHSAEKSWTESCAKEIASAAAV